MLLETTVQLLPPAALYLGSWRSPLHAPIPRLVYFRLTIHAFCWLASITHFAAPPLKANIMLPPPPPPHPPGSRSSPLALAAARHARTQLNICIDERSLAFWALGYGRASGAPAAVITSSGTAVANLLPAVVEASLSGVPMLVLTADRPFELRDTGANQTIDQVRLGHGSLGGRLLFWRGGPSWRRSVPGVRAWAGKGALWVVGNRNAAAAALCYNCRASAHW